MKEQAKVSELKKSMKSEQFWIVLIGIFYAVGIVGISLDEFREVIVPLSSFHLFLTFVVLYFSRFGKRDLFILYTFLLFFVGLLVEIIGTKTGLLFGNYSYGDTLGAKLFGVPVIIGVNWATMVVCSSTIVYKLKFSIWKKVLLAAFLMTGMDFLIEPVAMKLDYWQWENDTIPLYNYVCWFFISMPMHYFYIKWELVENNKVPKAVYIMLLLFFIVINLS
jgi:putative membrane protein